MALADVIETVPTDRSEAVSGDIAPVNIAVGGPLADRRGDMRRRFGDTGFIKFTGLGDPRDVERVLGTLYRLWMRSDPDACPIEAPIPWDADAFHAALIALRGNHPKVFAKIYDTMQISTALQSLAIADPITAAAAGVLETDPDGVAITGAMLRMDPPDDRRNALAWHQEFPHYPLNTNPADGCVLWMPLQDMEDTSGAFKLCLGSHMEGVLDAGVAHCDRPSYYASEQHRIPDWRVARFEQTRPSVEAGDALCFAMTTFHATGENVSNRIRLTFGVRFHRTDGEGFSPGRFRHEPSPS